MAAIQGRDHHKRLLDTFVSTAADGLRALVLEGSPGIGKTALAEATVEHARSLGRTVLATRMGPAESSMAYAALGDLLSGIPAAVLERLPSPQQAALEVALLRAEGTSRSLDPHAVSLATLSCLVELARQEPVIVYVDDAQWLDTASARALGFALRRLTDHPVGLLATVRTGDGEEATLDPTRLVPADRLIREDVGPLGWVEFAHMLRDGPGADLPRSVLVKIHQAAGGNPFYGLEIAREIRRRGLPDPATPYPVPRDALTLIAHQVAALPEGSREVLAAMALASRPTRELMRAITPSGGAEAALDAAEAAGVLSRRPGRLTFTHPLFSSAVLATTAAPLARTLHARLAAAVESPEERARHLALAATEPDWAIAEALDQACRTARARGAGAAAAEFAELALTFEPDRDRRDHVRRRVVAAMLAFEMGDAARARKMFHDTLAGLSPGPERARVLVALCETQWQDTVAIETAATQALAEAGADKYTLAGAHGMLAWVWVYRSDLVLARAHVAQARAAAGDDDDPELMSDALTIDALVACLAGEPCEDLIEEAVALRDRIDRTRPEDEFTIYSSARVVRGLIHLWAGEVAAARTTLTTELAAQEAGGAYAVRDEVLHYLSHVECRAGRWQQARDLADRCLDIGEDSGHLLGRGQHLVPRAWAAAVLGDLDDARTDALEAVRLSEKYGDRNASACAQGVLGLIELTTGAVHAAVPHLRQVIALLQDSGTAEPGIVPFVADAVVALVRAGQLDEARAIVADDRLMGRLSRSPATAWATGRGEATLLAAGGDLKRAATLVSSLLESDLGRDWPFERARLWSLLGDIERRRKHRTRARECLVTACQLFLEQGAAPWADEVTRALTRLGAVATAEELSPAEGRLVDLVVRGCTNKEVAATLAVSIKTVEAGLSRIYRKVGVRSRAELIRRMLADEGSS